MLTFDIAAIMTTRSENIRLNKKKNINKREAPAFSLNETNPSKRASGIFTNNITNNITKIKEVNNDSNGSTNDSESSVTTYTSFESVPKVNNQKGLSSLVEAVLREPVNINRDDSSDVPTPTKIIRNNIPTSVAVNTLAITSSINHTSVRVNAYGDAPLERGYVAHCEALGTMTSEQVFLDQVRKITRKVGWKNFKMLHDRDYHPPRAFAIFMIKSLGLSRRYSTVEEQEIGWGQVKSEVKTTMGMCQSAATQAMKTRFLGTNIHLSFFIHISLVF